MVAVGAVAFSSLWVILTDTAVIRLFSNRDWILAQSAKELAFCAFSGFLLYLVLRTLFRDLDKSDRHYAEAQSELIDRLALAAEFRDDRTGSHNYRIGHYAAIIGRAMGLSPAECDLLKQAAVLHDVGKIAVPDSILHKPGPLTREERQEMELHVHYGAQILADSQHPLVQLAHSIALTHHEAWDGTGYPRGIQGPEIPLEGRIVAVCDVFDALLSKRPYKDSWPEQEAVREILRLSGTRFDPRVVDALLVSREELIAVYQGAMSPSWLRFREPDTVPPEPVQAGETGVGC